MLHILVGSIVPVLLPCVAAAADCPYYQPRWVGTIGQLEPLRPPLERDAITDLWGNVFLAGSFNGATDFDPTDGVAKVVPHGDGFSGFLTKINADGSYAWTFVQQAPAGGAGSVGISEDSQGNLVLATNRGVDPAEPSIRISWLTPEGVPFRIVDFASGSANDGGNATDLALAPTGDVYLSGAFSGTIDFDPSANAGFHTSTPIFGSFSADPFVTKLNDDGSYAWTRTFGGSGFDTSVGVASDPEGNVIITGTFRGTIDFDPGPGVDIHVQQGFIEDSFITKFYANGDYCWTRTYPLRWINGKGKPAVDRHSNIFFTDNLGGTIDFNPDAPGGQHTATNGDVIVVKLSPEGEYVWSFSTSDGTGGENGEVMAIGRHDDVYVTGTFLNVSDFDPGPGEAIVASPFPTAFLLRLSSDGVFQSVTKLGEGGRIFPRSIAVAGRNEPVVIGRFEAEYGPVDFDPTCEENLRDVHPAEFGEPSTFIARYACIEPTADFSGDGFIELKEFARMAWCLTGPASAPGDSGDDPPEPIVCHPGCAIQDLDADGDIDLADLALFANAFTGAP